MVDLSICIPSINREETVTKVLEHIDSLKLGSVEVIVSDNSDVKYKLDASNYKNFDLIHVYTDKPLGFSGNFEAARKKINGEYSIFIGDDDTIISSIMKLVKLCKDKGIDSLNYKVKHNYIWPNNNFPKGYLYAKKYSGKLKTVDPKKELIKYIKDPSVPYYEYYLPKAYHGLIRSALLFNKNKIFSSLTPDLYSAVALTALCKNVMYIDYPITIPGVSDKSGAGKSMVGKHNGKLSDSPHFVGMENYEWYKKIPKVYSVQTIWASALYDGINNFFPQLKDSIGFSWLDYSLYFEKNIDKSMLKTPSKLKIFSYFFNSSRKNLIAKLRSIGDLRLNNIEDISQVEGFLSFRKI